MRFFFQAESAFFHHWVVRWCLLWSFPFYTKIPYVGAELGFCSVSWFLWVVFMSLPSFLNFPAYEACVCLYLTSLCLSKWGLVFNITFLAVTHYQLLGQARGEVERGVFKKYQFTHEHLPEDLILLPWLVQLRLLKIMTTYLLKSELCRQLTPCPCPGLESVLNAQRQKFFHIT